MSKFGLEPSRVFHYFEKIASIPHGSRNTKQISDYCKNWAIEHSLEYYQDASNNVIIIKEASAGRENEEPIIIQGHLDMVCEKAEGVNKDMDVEGLDLIVDGDVLKANGTTLGGDDGIAVAMALAILEDEELSHPRLEAVFTVDEEIGMLGAVDLDVSPLKGKTLLNIDSEEEGIFTVSCAGGAVATCEIPFVSELANDNVIKIVATDLTGGHSGVEIHKGRANANKVIATILNELLKKVSFKLISVNGGLKDNAIPFHSEAIICSDEEVNVVSNLVNDIAKPLIEKYKSTDPSMKIVVSDENAQNCMDSISTEKIVNALYELPEGVQKMSMDVEGLVQTSLNMGILKTEASKVSMSYCVRSSVDKEKRELIASLDDYMTKIGAEFSVSGDYPGWEYKKESPLRDLMVELYTKQYKEKPVIEAIHAGVECGIFAGKIPGLDCVSYGPNLSEIHTCRERMSISSVQRVYKMTREIIIHGVK